MYHTIRFKLLPYKVSIHNIYLIYRVYQNVWSGLEFDYIHKYGEQNYKY